MKAVAIRKGQERQKGAQKYHHIATAECHKCDAKYVISHARKRNRSRVIAAEHEAELRKILTEDTGRRTSESTRTSLNLNEASFENQRLRRKTNMIPKQDVARHEAVIPPPRLRVNAAQ